MNLRSIIFAFFLLLAGTNLVLFAVFSHFGRVQTNQIQSAIREKIVSSDVGGAREVLARLRPAIVDDYVVELGDVQRSSAARGFAEIPFYFDKEQRVLAGKAWVKLNQQANLVSLLVMNLLVGSLYIVGVWLVFRQSQRHITAQRDLYSSFLGQLEGILTARPVAEDPSRGSAGSQARIAEMVRSKVDSVVAMEREAAIGTLARQVAHDIRSPLAALNAVVHAASGMHEDELVLLRSAAGRIRDIANNLSSVDTSGGRGSAEKPRVSSIWSMVSQQVAESRAQHSGRSMVALEFDSDSASHGLFTRISSVELRRALSNLINNAVESIDGDGRVTVTVQSQDHNVSISLRDTGRGIPAEVLPLLGERGATFGKQGGSGLGIAHAKAVAESAGGRLSIRSELGRGTTVELSLPLAPAPPWFFESIDLDRGTLVVIVDDDENVHRLWDRRFSEMSNGDRIHTQHLNSGSELFHFIKSTDLGERSVLFLVDYEFKGEQIDGLRAVNQLGIIQNSILVTGRFDTDSLQEQCEEAGLRLMPKSRISQMVLRVRPKG